MKWTSILGLVLAFGSLGFVARAVFSPNNVDPLQVLARLEAAVEGEILESEPLLRLAAHALRHPSIASSPQLEARLLVAQADLYRNLESWHEARLCLERVSIAMNQASPGVQLRLAHILKMEDKPAEAWQLCVEILAHSPKHGAAWALRGSIESDQAQYELAEGQRNLSLALAGRSANEAASMAREIAMRSLDDPTRLRLVNQLRSKFEVAREGVLGVAALANLSEASVYFDGARTSYSNAVEVLSEASDKNAVSSGQQALGGLLTLMWGARQDLATAELGSIAAPLLKGQDSNAAILASLNALERLGQQDRAMELLKSIDLRAPDLSIALVQRALELAWSAQDHRVISQLASVLRERGSPIQRKYGSWFASMSLFERPSTSQVERIDLIRRGIRSMTSYLEGKRVPPMINATPILLLAAARGYGELEQPADEMRLLAEATQLAPALDGEAWVRLAELQQAAPGAGYRIPGESMTRGMALLPARALELVPAWQELGAASLKSENRSMHTMRRALSETGSALREYSPAARYLLALYYFEAEDYSTCQSLARRLRLDYPGLLPALDLELEGFLARGAIAQAGLLLMERLEFTGPDAKFRSFLARVGSRNLSDAQYRRLTQLDPDGEGRLAIAEQYLIQDQPLEALAALGASSNRAEETAQHHLLRAETMIRLGRPQAATQPAALAAADPQTSGAGWLLLIQSRLGGNPARLSRTVGQFLELALDTEGEVPFLEIVDTLLGASRALEAQRIARALDERSEHRGEALLQRLAICDALLGNDQELAETLDRWEAFRDDGAVEWTRLVLAIDRGEWNQLPSLAMELRRTEKFTASPWQQVFLAVCEEQITQALGMAQAGQQEHPLDPNWSLTLGLVQDLENLPIEFPAHLGESAVHELHRVLHPTDHVRLDPRRLLGLLAAAELEGWGLWALPRIASLSAQPSLWALMLAERAQQSLGQEDRAEQVRISVTKGHPTFSPAWVRREREAARKAGGDPWAEQVLALRLERRKTAGRQDLQDEARNTLDSALLAWDLGQPSRAQVLLSKYLKDKPNEHLMRWVLARIHASQGRHMQALGEMYRVWRELYPVLPSPEDALRSANKRFKFHPPGTPRTRELLGLISAATGRGHGQLRPQDAASLLSSLEKAIPHDPLILLARTRAESDFDAQNTSLAAARAVGALDLLHERLALIGLDPRGELSIEDVCSGAAVAWGSWLLEISPGLANEFLERELLRAPGRSDLWRLNAQALIGLGQRNAAALQLAGLSRASHSPEGQLLLASLQARSGATPSEVAATLAPAREHLNESQTALADFSEAWTDLQHGGPVGPNLMVLGRLWRERKNSAGDLDTETLGLIYLSALVHRNHERDIKVLGQLSASLLRNPQSQSYLPPTIRAMSGLSAALKAQQGAD
jgi:hypothetical protein